MRKWRTFLPTAALLIVLMTASFLAGYTFDRFVVSERLLHPRPSVIIGRGEELEETGKAGKLELRPLQTFWEVLLHVKRDYVEPVREEKTLTYGAISGLLAALEDPYTRFLDPKGYKRFTTETKGEFPGIGVLLGLTRDEAGEKEVLRILEVFEGGPAERAGVKKGDVILKIDREIATGLTPEQAANLIRGPEGEEVILTVGRKGVPKPLDIPIVREKVETPVVKFEMLEGKVGHVEIRQFNELTAAKLDIALDILERQGMRALILDLRNNPGGILEAAVAVVSRFVKSGPAVFTEERGKPEQAKYVTSSDYRGYDFPIVALINELSASGAEIVAGALQDYGVATLVGTKTFGKGKVQTVYKLRDGSAILITTAKYLTPKGRDINKVGIKPDKEVSGKGDFLLGRPTISWGEVEEAVKVLGNFVEGKNGHQREAEEAVETMRTIFGLVTEELPPDVQLKAGLKLIEEQMKEQEVVARS